ncbi:MAG: energy transducer TonB, partial [Deltaproteobacteria bacterium]|nr:energy transducer TonB [Deltaproteobacteria bacterium]
MVASLTFSFLTHVTAFAFSYNWNISPKEKHDQLLLVELIDLPVKSEVKQMAKREGVDVTHGRKAAKKEVGVKNKISDTPTYLSAKSDRPRTISGEMEDSTSSSSSFEAEATVSLDSQELKYVSYLSKIKRKIEPKWNYPEKAQSIGLQGKLALCFSIIRDGHLDRIKLLNSSGQPLLDEEALKAVKGAAPYYPLPDRLKISR